MRVGMDGTKLHYATLRYEVSSTEISPLRKKMYSTYSDACTSQRGRKEAHVCLFWATIFQGWPVSGRRNASMTLSTHVRGKRPGCLTRWRSSLHHCRSRVYKILEATLVRVLHSRRTSKQAQKSWPAFHALCWQIATCKGSHTTWWSPLNTGNITNCSTFHQRYRLRQLHQLNFPLQISFPYDVAIKWEPSNLIQTVSGGAAPHPLPLVGLSAVSRCGFRSQDHTHPAFLFRSVTWRLRLFRQWQLKRPATDQRLILRLTFPVDQLPVSSAF